MKLYTTSARKALFETIKNSLKKNIIFIFFKLNLVFINLEIISVGKFFLIYLFHIIYE